MPSARSGDSGASQVLVSRRSAPSSWSLPQLLTVDGGRSSVLSTQPRVAVAADGRALVVWQQNEGTLRSLWSSVGAAGGAWSAGVGITEQGVTRQFNDPALARGLSTHQGQLLNAEVAHDLDLP